ncbi:MMPL family transporter [Amycolatopsis suaedae]|uniref:MMPL family transporter n=1 Tax=Amycolatopsis suaedae TaxID=2510978 RepID=A0A4Q7J453_9PSEU|nr:MMPL family transporter [Amycolatopsis suaedae]
MERLSRFVLGHRRLTVVVALLLALGGGGALAVLLPTVSESNSYPGLPGYEANQRILDTYGTGGYERPYLPVITLPEGATVDDEAVTAALRRGFAEVAAATGARVVSYVDTGDRGFTGDGGRTTFALVFGGPVEQGGLPGSALGEDAGLDTAVDAALRPRLPPGAQLWVTGLDPLATGADTGGLDVSVKLLVTIGLAVLVLGWVFRSALALVPLLTALIALPVSLLGLLAAALVVDIHETTLTMVPLFGLGIAIDYALILVTRWREERARGIDGDEAVHRAMATAGRAVVFSGVAVGIGLLAMLVLPIPLLRSLAVGGAAVTAASAAVTLTVLPLLLSRARPRGAAREQRGWTAWARLVVRWRRPLAAGAAGLLAALSLVALGINLNLPVTGDLARTGPGHAGLSALRDAGVPTGPLTAFDVYVPPGTDPGAVAATLRAVPGVHAVAAPSGPAWRRDGSALLTVLPADEAGTPAGRDTVHRVRAAVPGGVAVGGNATQQLDYLTVTYGAFPWMLAVLAVLTFVVLARAFRSLLLPLKAIALNLLSLGAVLGVLVILWQWGWGTEALLGIQPDGVIGTFVPITVFAFLYGLSMDYEVFILARMREEYDRTGSTVDAVVAGVGRTGRLVTAAALILFFSFASMALGGELDVAVFASGVGLGILLDATLIRSVLLPATVAMLGRWNWWLPGWAARILRLDLNKGSGFRVEATTTREVVHEGDRGVGVRRSGGARGA